MPEARHYSEVVFVRMTPEVKAAVDEAARRHGSKTTHYAREAILTALRADRIDPAAQQPRAS